MEKKVKKSFQIKIINYFRWLLAVEKQFVPMPGKPIRFRGEKISCFPLDLANGPEINAARDGFGGMFIAGGKDRICGPYSQRWG